MNLVNIAKHLLYLTQTEFHFQNSTTSEDEVLTSQHLFEILKTFKDSYFNELHTYESLDFQDEYDEMKDDGDNGGEELIDEKESTDEEQNIENYEENQHLDIQNNFKLNEMKDIVEWVGQHPNYKIASIKHRFRKVKHMRYIERFREYIEANGTRLEKLKRIIEFMWNEFYVKRTIEKTAIQKASESFIAAFKRERRISSGSDHCSFQQEYISRRTLSFTGERTTDVSVKRKNNSTHSYTVQSITSADGQLLGKFFLILQEKENEFGTRVQKDLIVSPNVVVRASKSGKSSN
ncbi:unnamed protein product [Rotaria magnacalcarata]|uniref:Uncharacterized protein n=1 Tax=Rotaria magnacalcarata TaxID=392030 RepID=A0A816UIE2_9BILA|nr:unnamed protein product [Rotaria magnacalcarata]